MYCVPRPAGGDWLHQTCGVLFRRNRKEPGAERKRLAACIMVRGGQWLCVSCSGWRPALPRIAGVL